MVWVPVLASVQGPSTTYVSGLYEIPGFHFCRHTVSSFQTTIHRTYRGSGVTYITPYVQLCTAMYVSCRTSVDVLTVQYRSVHLHVSCLATFTSINPLDPFHSFALDMYTHDYTLVVTITCTPRNVVDSGLSITFYGTGRNCFGILLSRL